MADLSRVRRVLVYLAVLFLSTILGYFLAHLLESIFAGSSKQSAISILITAASVFSTNSFEERCVWGQIWNSSKNETAWIGGTDNSLLTGTAPAPIGFGISLGLLLKLML